ncbi:MAG: LTA synthase family protein [Verrucomicrobiaceae bacterium]|nr:LTA synthase family protein [Verrucomicrobiaceae bacterium]
MLRSVTRHLTTSPLVARGAILIVCLHLVVSLITRLALLYQGRVDLSFQPTALLASFGWGMWYDVMAGFLSAGIWVVIATLTPSLIWKNKLGKWLVSGIAASYGIAFVFTAIAEWFFWDEFQVRFNFIAVDYLVFTQEVWDNIDQSYPMPLVIGALATTGIGLAFLVAKLMLSEWVVAGDHRIKSVLVSTGSYFGLAACAATLFSQRQLPTFANEFNRELAKNGTYSFCAAFWESEIDFERFYRKLPEDKALIRARELLASPEEPLANPEDIHDLRRIVRGTGPEKQLNVMLVSVESLSAEFLKHYKPKQQRSVTPRLDELFDQGIWLRDLYATGTRTVRGLEALTLSVPPTPGQSIVWREGKNEHLFTLGSLFQARGYDTAYVYGGDAKFDFMRYFFSNNGYRVVDRETKSPNDWTFNNAWGVADEDLFEWTLKEADADYASGKRFFLHTMTVSNHRPFTFPEGHIDMMPNTGRDAAVKYTDWCIGHFIDEAKKRPWFKDTLFVIVADHCHGSAGKVQLDVTKYRIPCLFYSPEHIKPGVLKGMCSQIDIAPTIAGILNWSYTSRFFGHDVLRVGAYPKEKRRAFVSNYQKIAMITPEALALLMPKQGAVVGQLKTTSGDFFPDDSPMSQTALDDATAVYQAAAWALSHGALKSSDRDARLMSKPLHPQAQVPPSPSNHVDQRHPAGHLRGS